jgi:RIO-like serine/threonine protein kinase
MEALHLQFELLKRDLLGDVALDRGEAAVRRDTREARPWLRCVARLLAAREARALRVLRGIEGVPALLEWDGKVLTRAWLEGSAMQVARPCTSEYFRAARRLLARVHRAGVAHNDTAKEPNWLVCADGSPALVDFQLAGVFQQRGRLFRMLAREDLRHLLKHKRTYVPAALTRRERAILASPSWPARAWMATGKPAYMWFTRSVLGWEDREGAGDRNLP